MGYALARDHCPREGLALTHRTTFFSRTKRYLSRPPDHSGNFVFLGVALLTGVPCLYIGLSGLFGGLLANLGFWAFTAVGIAVIVVRTAEFLPTQLRGVAVTLRITSFFLLLMLLLWVMVVLSLTLAGINPR